MTTCDGGGVEFRPFCVTSYMDGLFPYLAILRPLQELDAKMQELSVAWVLSFK